MDTILSKTIGLIAGDGELPVKHAQSAQAQGFDVFTISYSPDNRKLLEKYSKKVFTCGPGEVQKAIDLMKGEGVNQITFIGKVSKGLLFRNPRLDSRAVRMIKEATRLNDDAVMLYVIDDLAKEGISVLDQTLFLKDFFPKKGIIGAKQPDESQWADIEYGFQIAKEIGRLDLGQSVVAQNKMILAVETIEGTDKTIERGCKMGDGKATVVKVSKPNQDRRFDMPAVGMRTLQTMKKYGATVLAIEAGETFAVEIDKMIDFVNKNNMIFVAV
ncbi:MAG: hypothetical protein A2Y25_10415 [Candidatus Melainabacteria bacterium GWF2_37_15]|nr:MAG: hypothetical protein A2Y25_10415 [Candidatus Melainabacteria bacterium GWF2_37_15]